MSGWIIALIVIAIILVLTIWVIGMYNSLIGMRNRVGNSWAQVDVLLKQRADLIPNLVEVVKGYATHESTVFEQVTKARAGVVEVANTQIPRSSSALQPSRHSPSDGESAGDCRSIPGPQG
ncbi:LemA, partial [Bifidobacterium animalis subsp. lactis]